MSLAAPSAEVFGFTYDVLSRRTAVSYPNGVQASSTYDPASQLVSLVHQRSPDSPLAHSSYTYDAIGNRTTLTDPAGLHTYSYDALNRLTQATHLTIPTEAFTYDPVGNRNPLTSTYDLANRLLEDDGFTYTYDANGNLTSKTDQATAALTTSTYDAENQLTRIDFPDLTFSGYAYDGLGRRIQKNVNGSITRYVYDNEDLLLEFDGTNTLTAHFLHGPGIDEPLMMHQDGRGFFYHADGLGSITALTEGTGAVVQTYTYDTFGQIVAETGALENPYTYTGREFDSESGLYYYRSRYYDPRTGRFLQEDPVSLITAQIPRMRLRVLQIRPSLRGLQLNPLNGNPYSYVLNNPVNRLDPNGEISQVTVAILTVLAILVAQGLELLISHLTQDVPLHVIKEKLQESAPEIREHRKELEEISEELDAEIDRSSAGCPLPRDGGR